MELSVCQTQILVIVSSVRSPQTRPQLLHVCFSLAFSYSLSYVFNVTILGLYIEPIKWGPVNHKTFLYRSSAADTACHRAQEAPVHLLSPSLQTEVIYSSSDQDSGSCVIVLYFLVFPPLTSTVSCPSAGFWKVDLSELRGCMNGQYNRNKDCF